MRAGMRKLPAATNDSNARMHDRNNIRHASASQLRTARRT